MTAATGDRETTLYRDGLRAYPVAAATTIYKGTAVAVNAAGNAVQLTDSSAVKFVGITNEGVINTSAEGYGTAGDLDVKVWQKHVHAVISSGLALTDQYKDLYWADDQTVQTAPTNQYAGKLSRYTSATEALLDIGPALNVAPSAEDKEQVFLPVAASETIASGDLVAVDQDGFLVQAGTATAAQFAGIALEAADNGSGSDGDIDCAVQRDGIVSLTTTSAVQTDVGKPVFVATDTTVTQTPADRNLFAGLIVKFTSATVVEVDVGAGVSGASADITQYPVAASESINVLGAMICLDAAGNAVLANDAAAVDFVGMGLTIPDNSAGSAGDLKVWVLRKGTYALTAAGLALADTGREVWVGGNAVTVTTTAGNILVGVLERFQSATVAHVTIKPLPIRGERADRRFEIDASYIGAVGSSSVVALEDMEHLRKYIVLAGYADAQTAPGSGYQCDIVLTDGTTPFTVVIDDTATHGENKTAGTTPMLANFDTDITLIDDNASGATADVKIRFVCEYL